MYCHRGNSDYGFRKYVTVKGWLIKGLLGIRFKRGGIAAVHGNRHGRSDKCAVLFFIGIMQTAVFVAVPEIDNKADCHPTDESNPCLVRQ